MGGVERAVRTGTACIGISGRFHTNTHGMRHLDIPGIEIIPVAAPNHPLAAPGTSDQRRPQDFVQMVLSERLQGEKRDFGVLSLNNWRISDLATKHRLLLDGIGWGGMPEEMVRSDIDAGRLVHLDLRDWRSGIYPLQVVHMASAPPGPAGRWFIENLAALPARAEPNFAPKTANPIKAGERLPSKRRRRM
jgi:DNA-binding transcriptional LysR family regulator